MFIHPTICYNFSPPPNTCYRIQCQPFSSYVRSESPSPSNSTSSRSSAGLASARQTFGCCVRRTSSTNISTCRSAAHIVTFCRMDTWRTCHTNSATPMTQPLAMPATSSTNTPPSRRMSSSSLLTTSGGHSPAGLFHQRRFSSDSRPSSCSLSNAWLTCVRYGESEGRCNCWREFISVSVSSRFYKNI